MQTPAVLLLSLGVLFAGTAELSLASPPQQAASKSSDAADSSSTKRASAILAGGCFWCVETDFEKLPGVVDVISGYSGGRTSNPNYENYKTGGHREVVFVMYDPSVVTFSGLVEYLVKHINPTDRRGQFNDRGIQYSPAVYYKTAEEKAAAEAVFAAFDKQNVFKGKKIGIALEPRKAFWEAEEYHQDYHHKNPIKYGTFRMLSGRDAFVTSHWGARASMLELPQSMPEGNRAQSTVAAEAMKQRAATEDIADAMPWLTFKKPKPIELKRKLSAIQYEVTQKDGTERAFRNEYWDNKKDGIYVDIVSGSPLFSSRDKFKSGTGWPSFVKPLAPDMVTYKIDRKFFSTRTEVRSRYGDSHLGHVFNDGPADRGGKRYCMNSAALRFIPAEKLEEEGYGMFKNMFETP